MVSIASCEIQKHTNPQMSRELDYIWRIMEDIVHGADPLIEATNRFVYKPMTAVKLMLW